MSSLSKRIVFACALLVAGLTGGRELSAQMPKGQLWMVHQEVVKPAMVAQFEATSKEFVAMVKQHQAAAPHFKFVCLQGEDMRFTYAVPIDNMAGVDAINGEFGALVQAGGAKFMEVLTRGNAAIESVGEWIVREDPEGSYMPASPRLKADEVGYYAYDFYYLWPGKEEEAKAIAKEFAQLYKSKNIADGYRIFWTVMGPDMPMLFAEIGAKDAADLAQMEAATQKALGAEGQALFAKANQITRRFERQRAWLRPDLSNFPGGM